MLYRLQIFPDDKSTESREERRVKNRARRMKFLADSRQMRVVK
jgi:hypothetical protein